VQLSNISVCTCAAKLVPAQQDFKSVVMLAIPFVEIFEAVDKTLLLSWSLFQITLFSFGKKAWNIEYCFFTGKCE